jgi:hypothetical protein
LADAIPESSSDGYALKTALSQHCGKIGVIKQCLFIFTKIAQDGHMADKAAAGRQNPAKLLKRQERVVNVLEYFSSQHAVETPGVETTESVAPGSNGESHIPPANLVRYGRAVADPRFVDIHA